MARKQPLKYRKYLESLIAQGLYDQILLIYETSLFNDLPYLRKMPSVEVLEHLLTLATFTQDQANAMVGSQVSNVERKNSYVSVRSLKVLETFISVIDSDDRRIATEDKNELRLRLIQLIESFLSYNDNFNGTRKAHNREMLPKAIQNKFWQTLQWAISCFNGEDASKIEYWRTYCPLFSLIFKLLWIDFKSKQHHSQTVICKLLNQLSEHSFPRKVVAIIFENVSKNQPAPTLYKNRHPLYKDEQKVLLSDYIIQEKSNNFQNLIDLQKNALHLIFSYIFHLKSQVPMDSLIDEIANNLTAYSKAQTALFFFPSQSLDADFVTFKMLDEKSRWKDETDINSLLMRSAVSLLNKLDAVPIESPLNLKNLSALNSYDFAHSLEVIFPEDHEISKYAYFEPKFRWPCLWEEQNFFAISETDSKAVIMNGKSSHYSKIIQTNIALYFLIQLCVFWDLQRVKNDDDYHAVKDKWAYQRSKVITAEEIKLGNFAALVNDCAIHFELEHYANQSVSDLFDERDRWMMKNNLSLLLDLI